MTNKLTYLFLAFALLIFATSCEDEDPPICSCEELVTRVTWTLTPTDAANETVQFSFVDDDGDGGNAPIISSTGTLAANASYTGSVIFANESEPVNPEIIDENDEHQVFYPVTTGLNLTIAYGDMDSNGNPLGLLTSVTTGAASTGDVQVVLRRELMKGSTVTIDDPTTAGGETDVEITFAATIQ